MDLNRDELRRELKAIDADNKAAMPKWYDGLRQIVGGGTKMSTDEKAALLGVPAPGRRQFHLRSDTAGNPTSRPIWLNVIPPSDLPAR